MLIFCEAIVEMLAREESGSDQSKRYIFDVIVFSPSIKKNSLKGSFFNWCGQELGEKNQPMLIFCKAIVEMLAREESGSDQSKRYIFDGIVFSAIHKKTP